MTKKYIIAGASAAGISAAKEILSVDPDADLLLISAENSYPYHRPMLSELIAEKSIEDKNSFYLNKPEWYQSGSLKFMRGLSIKTIDRVNKTVFVSNGEKYSYDRLILATGSRPFIPIKGEPDGARIFSLRTYDDAKSIAEAAQKGGRAAVIGGGLLGLEAAYSLKKLGLHVDIVELAERIMPMQLDEGGSAFICDLIQKSGVTVNLCDCVENHSDGGDSVSLSLKSGLTMEVDLLVLSAGVRPETGLAASCGLTVNRGVVVDKYMTTSDADIFACGDMAEFEGKLIPLWMPALKKGKTAGSNAAGKIMEFSDEDYPVAISAFDTRIFSAGITSPADKNDVEVIVTQQQDNYSSILLTRGILTGFVLIGDTALSQKLLKALKSRQGADYLRAEGLIK